MYASNEEEDWVYLHKTPTVKTISQQIVHHHTDLERENRLLEMTSIDDSFLLSQTENDHYYLPTQTSTIEENEFIVSDENSTIERINDSDIEFEFKSSSNTHRRCTTDNAQQTDFNSRKYLENQNSSLVFCICLIILLTLPFIFGRFITPWDQPTMNQIANELVKTNQRLNEIRDIPIGNLEEKLTKQIEEKLQNMINQQMAWYEHEKVIFISQIHGLRQILKKTQENFTNTIHHLNDENERLQEQIKSLEQRLEVTEEQYSIDEKTCLKGVNCTKSSSLTLDKFVANLFKRTASIVADTSVNLSDLFQHLRTSMSNIVDHRYEYIKASQRTLSINNLSSSFRKMKSWMKSRDDNPKPSKKFPWRWRFSRVRMYFPSSTKEQVCYSKFNFPMNKICSMKNWMGKLFRF